MIIKDLTGKEREITDIKKIKHKHRDVINNVDIIQDFVEVMIKGKNLKWKMFYPLQPFMEMNPNVSL